MIFEPCLCVLLCLAEPSILPTGATSASLQRLRMRFDWTGFFSRQQEGNR
jgi:hypothetical protein